MADTPATDLGVDGDRADLRQVLPEHVQCTAADDPPGALRHPELLDVLIERDRALLQQAGPDSGVRVDEAADHPYVGRPGTTYDKAGGPDSAGVSSATCSMNGQRSPATEATGLTVTP